VALAPVAARADAATHEIQKAAPATTVGNPGRATLKVVGKNGWHVNGEAPITVAVKADTGVDLPKPKLTRADLAESTKESARFEIPFSASAAGKKVITADARFVMCMEQACKPVHETVAFEVDVAAPAPPPPPPTAAKSKRSAKRP